MGSEMCIRDSLLSSQRGLWFEHSSGSQHGGFGTTPAFVRAPLVQSARPCGLNTALDHSTEALERHPPSHALLLSRQRDLVVSTQLGSQSLRVQSAIQCERWQGVKLVGVLDLIGRQSEKLSVFR